MKRVLVCSIVSLAMACKAKENHAASDEPEVATRTPSPTNTTATYAVDDDVALLDDQGTLILDARVLAIGGPLVREIDHGPTHMDPAGWVPTAEGKHLTGREKTAASGYQLRVGGGKESRTMWFPSTQVFPVPWAGVAHVVDGDTVYQIHSGEAKTSKCVVMMTPSDAHGSITAKCDGEDRGTAIDRTKLVHALEPALPAAIQLGDRVYFDNQRWAIVVGRAGAKVTIREAGVMAKDEVVDTGRLQIAR